MTTLRRVLAVVLLTVLTASQAFAQVFIWPPPATTSGNYPLVFTLTGSTGVTLPTSGTLVNSAVTSLPSLTSMGTIASLNATALTITPAVNTSAVTSAGASLTGSNATSFFNYAGTWNTSGNPSAFKLAVTNTASGSTAKLFELLAGAGGVTSMFSVSKDGTLAVAAGAAFGQSVAVPSNTSFVWSGASRFISPTNGLINAQDNGQSMGIQFNVGTAAPTVTACGTGIVTSGSRNTGGEITATGATACTVTFGSPAWTNAPFCTVTLANAVTTTPYISASSTTAFTVSGLTANDVFKYLCMGRI